MNQPLQTITIPEYMTKVKTSESRRAKYYNKYDGKGKSKTWDYDTLEGKYEPIKEDYDGPPFKLPAPKTKLIKLYEGDYEWNSQGYLRDKKTGDRIIANPRSAGTPNYEPLSGNKLSSGYGNPIVRAKLVGALKDFYRPFVQDQLVPFNDTDFPLTVEWECYTQVNRSHRFDLSNFWFYYKYFEDCLTEEEDNNGNAVTQMIPDDNIRYITKPASPLLIPVDEWEDRKFIFKFYKDKRQVISKNEFWN